MFQSKNCWPLKSLSCWWTQILKWKFSPHFLDLSMGSKRIVGDLVCICGEQRYTAKPLSSHVFSFSVSRFPDMLLKYAKKSHPFSSKIWKKILTCWMLTFQKSYKFHHFHHLNLSCDLEFNCSSRNIWTISGGCRKWGSQQIIPKLNHVRKFSLETSIETDEPLKIPLSHLIILVGW
jgi:hypothetical protein